METGDRAKEPEAGSHWEPLLVHYSVAAEPESTPGESGGLRTGSFSSLPTSLLSLSVLLALSLTLFICFLLFLIFLSVCLFVCLSVCLTLSLSSEVWLELGSQPRDGVGVEVVDFGLVTPGLWSSLSSQLAFFEARTG